MCCESLFQFERFITNYGIGDIGRVLCNMGRYNEAIEYFQKMTSNHDWFMASGRIWHYLQINTYLQLSYKKLGKKYDLGIINDLLLKTKYIEYETHYHLYQLFEDTTHLYNAYSNVMEKANAMENEFKAKFLSYPIPKAIVEEWQKVK